MTDLSCLQRWFLEGGVVCFGDAGHIVLGLIAILVLSLLILLIPVTFVFTIIGTSYKLRVYSTSILLSLFQHSFLPLLLSLAHLKSIIISLLHRHFHITNQSVYVQWMLYLLMFQKKTRTIGWLYEALTAGYRDSYETRWWVSWELLRRLLLITLSVALPGRTVSLS